MSKQLKLFDMGVSGGSGTKNADQVRDEKAKKRKQSKNQYEAKRTRKFIPNWNVKYPGIYEEDDKLYCKSCKLYPTISDASCSLVTGNTSFRVGGLDTHWQSKRHLQAANHHHAVQRAQAGENVAGPMDIAIRAMNEANKTVLKKLFNTAYFILKYEEPFTAFRRLLALQEKNGSDLSRLLNYRSDQACRRLMIPISEVIREPILESIREADAISVLFDGATDASVTEVEVVFVRYVKDGTPTTSYLSLQGVQHANAQGVYEAIDRAFTSHGLEGWKDKLVGVGCDGAPVNIGKQNSVSTRIQGEDNRHVLIIHCVAHRLELGVLQAIKNNRMLEDVKDILKKVHKHYKYSTKAVREVRELAATMEEHFQKPNRIDGTRWTPHMRRAIEILADSYKVLLTHFEHVSQAAPGETTADVKGRATFLVRKLRDMKILKFVHFMRDLLEIIAQLSLAFQKDDCTVNTMLDAVETVNLQLTALTLAPGAHLAAFNAEVQEDPADPNSFIYKGVPLKNIQNEDNIYTDVILDVQNRINNCLESERDPATDILRAARMFDVAEWPHGRQDLAIYGDVEIAKLLEHFEPLLNRLNIEPGQVRQEWVALKAYISNANWLPLAACFTNGQEPRFHHILKLYE